MADRDPQIVVETSTPLQVTPTLFQRVRKLLLMLLVPALLIGGVTYYYKANENFISTDNAYVQQDKMSVSSEVSGRIVAVGVHENQRVNAGDLLFRIDPEPFRIAMAQADASIAAAQAKVTGLEAAYQTSDVDIASTAESVAFFERDYSRQAELMRRGFTTRARVDAARHAVDDARGKLAKALAGQVQKRKAVYDLNRTELRAPVSGIVSQGDRMMVGQMLTQNLPAMSIIVSDKSWVEANFKETDLAKMRVGQPARLIFDAYPDMVLKGHVASIGAGTGSEFSVLPAQNANGNWVKVTQRVPVRIAIDDKPTRPLIAGLSTRVRIDAGK
jgi:membrane fusion protein, multidrug efflux system